VEFRVGSMEGVQDGIQILVAVVVGTSLVAAGAQIQTQ